MTIEAEFYSYRNKGRRTNRPTFKGEVHIRPGSSEIISYLSPLEVLVTLNVDNNKGTVLVKNPSNKLTVRRFIDEDDEIGVVLDSTKPMELKKGQELVLSKKTKRTLREISLLLLPDEHGNDVPIPRFLMPDTV